MDKVVKTFRTVAQVPSVAAAKILRYGSSKKLNQISVYSWWSQRCLERGKSIKFQQTYIVNTCNEEIVDLMPVDASNEIISSFSPSEELRAVVRDIQSQENGSKKLQHLEIWKKSQLSSVSDLTALDVHGDVYADSEFGCFEWSPCEKKILYIAEKKVPKSEPFYKQKAQGDEKKDDTGSGDSKVTKGEEYVYRQEWGEQLVGKHQPVVVVFDIREEKIVLLEGIPDNLSPAKATWAPDGGIVGVAWENEPRRLGLMFCTNRPSYIFHLSCDGNFKILSEKGLAVRAPRFSPDGKKLIWLERPAGGPHHNAHRLVKYSWTSGKTDIVIDIVNNKLDTVDPLYFRGLYNQGFPKRCWLSDNEHIVFSTPGPSSITSCLVSTDNKKITLLKPFGDEQCSSVILDVIEDTILCTRSTFRHPTSLVIGKLSSSNYENIEWISVTKYECFPGLSNAKQGLYNTTATSHVTNDVNEINAIYLQPATDSAQKVPVIIFPHGGPHANFVNSFSAQVAFFVMLGYGVVMVNYRGSTGFGQDYTNFLLGKIGDSDVKDMHQVAEELCNSSLANFDSSRKVLYGGSHGGFLVCHLSGQYPETFKAVATVNPVTDVASMIGVTDIPDWCAVESGEAYSPLGETTKEDFNKMHDASPIRYAKQVTAPTLLLIGKKDLRVPPSQGLQYHYKLKAHNIKTKLLLYEDNHPLAQVPVEMDSLINSALWFNEHLKIAQE